MFEILYYMFVLYFLWIEMSYIIDVNARTQRLTDLLEKGKLEKGKDLKNMDSEYIKIVKSLLFEFLTIIIVVFVGLFTIHWPIWVGMLIISVFIVSPINKRLRKNGNTQGLMIVTWLNSVLGFGSALFILINKFHLHIDVVQVVENLLKTFLDN